MRFNRTVQLIAQVESTDALGRPQVAETVGDAIPCIEESVGVVENYQAMAIGVSPSVKLKVRRSEYTGQKAMQYGAQRYRVVRASQVEKGFTVLVGEAVGRA